ncbi:hypothetical protein SCLCIDRAFT_1215959 [Scleroderma citrinum Foug A]|uniref:Secreted protein n=1 Tax=Scleroderma citrinum Foug A TaxID=1036808 RepID=A0A0C3E053_9AGAM|nr:hypothetical protein SCLCIDRAFT_1215959 [Scleroderma citrinum Foug A]
MSIGSSGLAVFFACQSLFGPLASSVYLGDMAVGILARSNTASDTNLCDLKMTFQESVSLLSLLLTSHAHTSTSSARAQRR